MWTVQRIPTEEFVEGVVVAIKLHDSKKLQGQNCLPTNWFIHIWKFMDGNMFCLTE